MRANLCRRKSTVTLDWKLSRAEHVPVSILDRSCQTINASLFDAIQRYELADLPSASSNINSVTILHAYIRFTNSVFRRSTFVKERKKKEESSK